MPEQTPTQPDPQAAPQQPSETAPAASEKQPPWGKPENFDPDKAWELIQNLRSEKAVDPQLRSEFDSLKQQQQEQRDALARALGIKPEETSDTERLTKELGSLREQITASERRALAAEHKVPETLLTASDAEGMRAQALALVEFAQGAHVAATPPAFQPNPGQGQGNAPLTPEQQAAAEYEQFYPSK